MWESGKPTKWALDPVSHAVSVTHFVGSNSFGDPYPGFRCVPCFASALRFTLGFIRVARIRGLRERSQPIFPKLGVGKSGTILAERVGFEPTVEFPLHTLSKRAP